MPRQARMTELDRSILELVSQGLTNEEISDVRGVSVKTTETQLRRIAQKMAIPEGRTLRHHMLHVQHETLRELGLG